MVKSLMHKDQKSFYYFTTEIIIILDFFKFLKETKKGKRK